jgi:hypothetical protein
MPVALLHNVIEELRRDKEELRRGLEDLRQTVTAGTQPSRPRNANFRLQRNPMPEEATR